MNETPARQPLDAELWDVCGRKDARHRLAFQFDDRSLVTLDQLVAQGHQVVSVVMRNPVTGEERTLLIPQASVPHYCGPGRDGMRDDITQDSSGVSCPHCGAKRTIYNEWWLDPCAQCGLPLDEPCAAPDCPSREKEQA